jgi:hypothetical protein
MSELSQDTGSPASRAGRLQTETTGDEIAQPLPPRTQPETRQGEGPDFDERYPNSPAEPTDSVSGGGSPRTEASDPTPTTAPNSRSREARPTDNFASSTDEQQQDRDRGMSTAHPLVKEASVFRSRWESVQVSFVDDPRQAVSDAESLVGDVLNDLTAGFRHQRQELESIWNDGQEASTEHLRQTLQRYRDFFERLLRI